MTTVQTRAPRPEKVAKVEEISTFFEEAHAVLLTEYRGLPVSVLQDLRKRLRESDARYVVVKCSLARLAVEKLGISDVAPMLFGPTALVLCGEDIGAAAKTVKDFAKENEALVLKGGYLEGSAVGEADVQALASLPSRSVLLSQIAGLLQAPTQQMATLLQAPIVEVSGLFQALVDKREAG